MQRSALYAFVPSGRSRRRVGGVTKAPASSASSCRRAASSGANGYRTYGELSALARARRDELREPISDLRAGPLGAFAVRRWLWKRVDLVGSGARVEDDVVERVLALGHRAVRAHDAYV